MISHEDFGVPWDPGNKRLSDVVGIPRVDHVPKEVALLLLAGICHRNNGCLLIIVKFWEGFAIPHTLINDPNSLTSEYPHRPPLPNPCTRRLRHPFQSLHPRHFNILAIRSYFLGCYVQFNVSKGLSQTRYQSHLGQSTTTISPPCCF